MKKIILLNIILAFSINLFAQTDTIKLSLSQAIQYGLSSRFDIKADSLNKAIAENNIAITKKELLPDLSANGNLTYYNDLQPSIVPAGYLGFAEPQKIAIGMKNNTAFSLDLTYTIFKPGLYTDIQLAKNHRALIQEQNIKKILDVKTEISESYYNVLLKKLQYEIAQRNEQRYKEYYSLASGKFNNGSLIESDASQAELDYKSSQSNTEKLRQNYFLSLQSFRYKINLSAHTMVVLSDSLQAIQNVAISSGSLSNDAANRSELKQLKIEQTGNELQLKKVRQNYSPSLSVFANYTRFFQGPEFNYSDNFYWAPVDYAGVKLTIPITGSVKNINTVRENKLKIAQADFNLKQKEAEINYEIEQAITTLINAKKNLIVATNNYSLSRKVYEIKKQQYSLGAYPYEKILDTERSLNSAEQDYITAVFDFLIARINYDKAKGN